MALKANEQAVVNLVINGDQAKASLKEVTGAYNALRSEVSKMKEADDPAAYQQKIADLQQIKQVQDEMTSSIRGTTAAIQEENAAQKTLADTVSTGFQQIKGAFSYLGIGMGISELVSFSKEMIQVQVQISNVQSSFAKIPDAAKQLDAMRKASRGLITDLDLEKIATKANNANIPLKAMGTLLEFAQQRAKDTGGDVTELTDTLINGIGKNSPKALSALGVSVKEVKLEFQKTGDMVTAVTNIINREMNSAGKDVDTFGERIESANTRWDNAKDKMSKFFIAFMGYNDLADQDVVTQQSTKNIAGFGDYTKKSDAELNILIANQQKQVKRFEAAYQNANTQLENFKKEHPFQYSFGFGDAETLDSVNKISAEDYQSQRNALAALMKEQEKRTVGGEEDDQKNAKDQKKLEEFKKELADVRQQADQLAQEASKGTVDDLNNQLKVIEDKYQKVVDKIKQLLKDPHLTAPIRTELQKRLSTMSKDEDLDKKRATIDYNQKQDEQAKKEKDEQFTAGKGQVDNIYASASSDLNNQQNTALNAVKGDNPAIVEAQRYNIQQLYAQKSNELEQSHLQALKILYEGYGKDTAELDKKIADNTIKENDRAAKEKEKQDKAYKDAKKSLQTAEMDTIQQGAEFLETYLGKNTIAYKAALIVDKAIAAERVILNTEAAIAAYAASVAGLGPPGLPLLAEYTITERIAEGISLATIAAQTITALDGSSSGSSKKAAKGGLFDGPSHAQGGLNVVDPNTGETKVNVEGGEPWMVLSKDTMANNGAVINQLLFNSMYRNGAKVDVPAVSNGIKMAKSGGVFMTQASAATTSAPADHSVVLADHSQKIGALADSLNQLTKLVNKESSKKVVFNRRVAEIEDAKVVQIRDQVNA